jgi:diguanylate cyclase (GGDEF)-like protein
MERDLREAVERALMSAAESIAADAFAGAPGDLNREQCRRVGLLIVQLLSRTVRHGGGETSGDLITELHQLMVDRGVSVDRLFGYVYLVERTALDELASNPALGATTEPWPLLAALIRRASFDVLAACATLLRATPDAASIVDPQTGIQSRAIFETMVAKELGRAARRGEAVGLLLFDVDHLSYINAAYGRAIGDRVLERVRILIKGFFRQADWVGKSGDDEIGVLLTGRDAEQASQLAEEVRRTVEARMRIEAREPDGGGDTTVTVSGAVALWTFSEGATADPDRLRAQAESARARAKRLGRNRIERAGPYSAPISS